MVVFVLSARKHRDCVQCAVFIIYYYDNHNNNNNSEFLVEARGISTCGSGDCVPGDFKH